MFSRVILFLSGFLAAGILGFFAIQYAQGMRFDINKFKFARTGILVATSQPNGAQVLINGQLRTATNQTIDIVPEIIEIGLHFMDGEFPLMVLVMRRSAQGRATGQNKKKKRQTSALHDYF